MKRLSLYRCTMCILSLSAFIAGCATVPSGRVEPVTPTVKKSAFPMLSEQYRNKAVEYEKTGELRKALQNWQIVNSLSALDEEAIKKTAQIKSEIDRIADEHFKRGVAYYQKKSMQSARKEFLIALQYNSDHQEALDYLKNRVAGEHFSSYEVKKGDTLKEIAKRIYKDPQKEFLIAYFNNLGGDNKLVPKSSLKLPLLDQMPRERSVETDESPTESPTESSTSPSEIVGDSNETLNKARAYYKAKNYQETVSYANKILDYDPANKEARTLANTSNYQIAKVLIQKKRFEEALAVLNHIEPSNNEVKESITYVKKQLANIHYLAGVKYYLDQELNKAIKEWEATLVLEPNHPKAKNDIENARSLLQKLGEIK